MQVANPAGNVYFRFRVGTGSYTTLSAKPAAASVTFDLTGLAESTTYNLEASLESDYTPATVATVTTPARPAATLGTISATATAHDKATISVALTNGRTANTVYYRWRKGTSGTGRRAALAWEPVAAVSV